MRRSMALRVSTAAGVLLLCAGLAACGQEGTPAAEQGPATTRTADDPSGGTARDGAVDDGAGGAAGGGAAASCVAAISFQDRLYFGTQAPDLAVGAEVGEAVTPPCNDTGGSDEQPSKPFTVLSIDGIEPSIAVATESESGGYWVWFRPGTKGQVPSAVQELLE
jgi:hypothetical protein